MVVFDSEHNYIDFNFPTDFTGKNILILGNTIGMFGVVDEKTEYRLELTCPDVINNMYLNLENFVADETNKLVIVGDKDVQNYYKGVMNFIKGNSGLKCKNVLFAELKDFAKKTKLKVDEDKIDTVYLNILEGLKDRAMTFDYIISNPPFNVGAKIVNSIIENAMNELTQAMVIGPMSMYKSKENFKHILNHKNVTNCFKDADITKNLSVTELTKTINPNADWKQIEMESYDQKFIDFYEVNSKLPLKYVFKRCDNAKAEDFDIEKDYVDNNRFCNPRNGFTLSNTNKFYAWNVNDIIPPLFPNGLSQIHFTSYNEKHNFAIFANSNKKNLFHSSMFGLNMDTISKVLSIAIPQIDWEKISDHPLWQAGDYDGAVLDVMGLKWNDNHDGVVRK